MSGGDERAAVLVIAAHPDDEVLGCGGVLALHARAGDPVTVVIVCRSQPGRCGPLGAFEDEHIFQAAAALGVGDVRCLGYRDQALETVRLAELADDLVGIVREVRPRVVYCQYGGDVNRDHHLLFQAALVATRPTETCIEAVYAFDTASSTEWAYPRSFVPDLWVDITETLPVKLEAMSCYRSELRDYPHPRSLEGLACRARAFGNQVCLDAAEVFMTIRRVSRNGQARL